ncbi:MAG: bifunctional cytidylyltransferase/SDR family oxidoreductase [Microbacterium sp.]
MILAGGVGERADLGMPKQLARIAGKTIIEHTLESVCSSPDIDDVIVMMEPSHIGPIEDLVSSTRLPKLSAVYPGGATRNETTRLALGHIADDEAKVLLHDAVRPFIDHRILSDCVRALDRYDAVDTAIPSADTIITVGQDGSIADVPPRASLRRGQTPQAFLLSVIREAYERAATDASFVATDDCTVVLRYLPETPIAVVDGSTENMKITEPVDVFLADKLFQLRRAQPAGIDDGTLASHLDGKTLVVFGGSKGIGAAIAAAAQRFGADVFSYSRGATGTHVQKRDEVAAALADANATSGRIDYVVNCAGALDLGELEFVKPKEVKKSLKVNLLGPIIVAQESLSYLRASRGQLLFFASSSYTRGRAQYGIYSATKAATVNLAQSLGDEWAADGVRVNVINPQRTDTPMRTAAFGQEPGDTLLSADEVALAALKTLTQDVTGQVIDVRKAANAS